MYLRNDKGLPVKLLRPLAEAGGEGQVFEIENSTATVAKLYHEPVDSQKATKLRYMVQSPKPELRTIAAWPTGLLLDPQNPKTVRGIIMPRMPGKAIHKLYGPSDRAAEFPAVRWDFLIHVAMNCAAVFETLHEQQILMADVNEGNLLVKEADGQIGLIDCDSYQLRNGTTCFQCDVGIPMWTPPELQGQNFRGLLRTPNHDRFGLAVLIFRLLFMGRHPFAGIPVGRDQFAIEEAIKHHLFAFVSQTWSRGVKAPPRALTLAALPKRLGQLFERAFLQGSEAPNARPTGREWAQELKALLPTLKNGCIDPGHKYWDGLTSCPWCQIVSAGGPNFFISVSVHLGSVTWAADCARFWAAIERVAKGSLMYEQVAVPALARATPRPMPLGRPAALKVSAPVAPTKPAPPQKAVVPAPVLPVKPLPVPPARLPSVPLGPTEAVMRISFLGTCFFAIAAFFSFNMELSAAAMGAGWGAVVCFAIVLVKSGQGRTEMRQRKEAERSARVEERRTAAEEHARRMSDYEARVEDLTKQHTAALARAEAARLAEWGRQDQEYQKAYNQYLAEQRTYDAAQTHYAEEVALWNAEVDVRIGSEDQTRRGLSTKVEQLEALLNGYKAQVRAAIPALEAARQRFEKARQDELADMRQLHQTRQALQMRQFLAAELIQNADIPNIGSGRKATLNAYGIGSALEVQPDMDVPGFGNALVATLMAWRRQCEGRFRYNPNTKLPTAEVNAVKIKHAQTSQSALTELREGAAKLNTLEQRTQAAASQGQTDLMNLARAHVQSIADLAACA
jgi:DNA-binding helix-hairpin-helix protein with protein kinase domain